MSKITLTVRPVAAGDADELAKNLRPTDIREIQSTSMTKPLIAIHRCIHRSQFCYTGLIDGKIAFIGGVTETGYLSDKRSPWLLGTDLLEKNYVTFLRYCKFRMPYIKQYWPNLENYIDARSTATIRWLKWLGFTIHEAEPYGILRRPFHRFTLKAGPDV